MYGTAYPYSIQAALQVESVKGLFSRLSEATDRCLEIDSLMRSVLVGMMNPAGAEDPARAFHPPIGVGHATPPCRRSLSRLATFRA